MTGWRWSWRKKTIKLKGQQLIHYRAAVIMKTFRVINCVKLENQDRKPHTKHHIHQLLVTGSDRPPPSRWRSLVPKKLQQQEKQHKVELVLGFDSLEECQRFLEAATTASATNLDDDDVAA